MKKKLILFDFDGTITTKDTLMEFIRFYHGTTKFLLGLLIVSPILGLFILKLIPNWKAKEKVLWIFFKGENMNEFNQKCEAFCKRVLPKLIRPKAIEEISNHKNENAEVAVISASAENWVRPWCKAQGIGCLATHLEVKDGKLTGRIEGFNCYGPEKENRIRSCYTLTDYDEIYAYGDSNGDKEMLALAHHQFYKPFRT